MELQYIIDKKGRKSGVLLPISDWEKITHELEEFEALKRKNIFVEEFKEAIENLQLVKDGKLQARKAKDLLDEL